MQTGGFKTFCRRRLNLQLSPNYRLSQLEGESDTLLLISEQRLRLFQMENRPWSPDRDFNQELSSSSARLPPEAGLNEETTILRTTASNRDNNRPGNTRRQTQLPTVLPWPEQALEEVDKEPRSAE